MVMAVPACWNVDYRWSAGSLRCWFRNYQGRYLGGRPGQVLAILPWW